MKRVTQPRLPIAPAEPEESTAAATPPGDRYRKQLMDDERLTIMHTRIYDYWRPRVGAPDAYALALVAFKDDAAYQALKRRLTHHVRT